MKWYKLANPLTFIYPSENKKHWFFTEEEISFLRSPLALFYLYQDEGTSLKGMFFSGAKLKIYKAKCFVEKFFKKNFRESKIPSKWTLYVILYNDDERREKREKYVYNCRLIIYEIFCLMYTALTARKCFLLEKFQGQKIFFL